LRGGAKGCGSERLKKREEKQQGGGKREIGNARIHQNIDCGLGARQIKLHKKQKGGEGFLEEEKRHCY